MVQLRQPISLLIDSIQINFSLDGQLDDLLLGSFLFLDYTQAK